MNQAIVQFTISDANDTKRLARRDLVEFPELPCEVPGPDGAPVFALESSSAGILASPLPGIPLLRNGEPCTEATPLATGEQLTAAGRVYTFFLKHGAVPLSWQSRSLAFLSRFLVVVFLLLEVMTMGALPFLLSRSSATDRGVQRQQIYDRFDQLRARIRKMDENAPPLEHALLEQLLDELNQRARFLRNYEEGLRNSQRRELMAYLERVHETLDRLEQNKNLATVPEVDVDGAIRKATGLSSH